MSWSMKVVNGVGYENSSGSHFKSSDIWASATNNNEISTGWLGRYYDEKYLDYLTNPTEKPLAIQIGSRGNLIFNGEKTSYAFAVSSPERLKKVAENGTLFDTKNLPDCTHGDQIEFLRRISNATYSYASVIHEAYNESEDFNKYDAENDLDTQLSLVSRLMKGGLGSKIYMVSMGGFDTHANQANRQSNLLKTFSTAMEVFVNDLKQHNTFKDTLILTFSEFGRRVQQNGAGGTDHGAANNVFVIGEDLKTKGFYNAAPNLSKLDKNGDLIHTVDFRSIYATVLDQWLQVDDVSILNKSFSKLDFI